VRCATVDAVVTRLWCQCCCGGLHRHRVADLRPRCCDIACAGAWPQELVHHMIQKEPWMRSVASHYLHAHEVLCWLAASSCLPPSLSFPASLSVSLCLPLSSLTHPLSFSLHLSV
jgi:hypothetical protein